AGPDGGKGTAARTKRDDGPRRRRPPPLHDARERPDGESGRVVGLALDRGSHSSQAARRRRLVKTRMILKKHYACEGSAASSRGARAGGMAFRMWRSVVIDGTAAKR